MTLRSFAKEVAGPLLQPLGFRLRSGTFERSTAGVRQIAGFMKYRGTPHFNVRLQVSLAAFQLELGVVASADLSHLLVPLEEWWPWPPADSTRAALTAAISERGLPWFDTIGTPQQLAAYLEKRRVVSPVVDAAFAKSVGAFTAAGVQAMYQSPGFLAPRAGQLRRHVVEALSFCYELCGEWAASLRAWDQYCGTWETPFPEGHHLGIRNTERRRYLQAQVNREGTGDDAQ